MDKTTLYLPSELHLVIKAIARRTGRPRAALIREALREYVDRQQAPPLLSLGIIEDAGVHSDEIDDWLKANWRPDTDWGTEADAEPIPERPSA